MIYLRYHPLFACMMVLTATIIENALRKTCAFRMNNWLWTWNHHMQTAIERNLLCFWWNLFIFIFLYMAVLFAFGSMFCIWLNFFVFWCISSLSDLQTSMGGASPYALSSVDGGGSQSLLSLVSLYFAFDFFCILCLISCVFCVWFLVYIVKHVIRAGWPRHVMTQQ